MKTIRALNRWRKGYTLSSSDQHRVDDFFVSLKVAGITLALVLAVLVLIDQSGCLEGNITYEEMRQTP